MMNAYSNINDPPSPQAGPPEVPAFPADDLLPPQPEPAPGPTAHQSSKAAALIDGSETVLGVSAAAFHPLQPLWQLRGRGGRTRAQTDGGWNELVTKGEVRCLAASADGSALLTGSSNVRLWEARTGANTHTVMMKPRTTTKCAASQPPRLPPPPQRRSLSHLSTLPGSSWGAMARYRCALPVTTQAVACCLCVCVPSRPCLPAQVHGARAAHRNGAGRRVVWPLRRPRQRAGRRPSGGGRGRTRGAAHAPVRGAPLCHHRDHHHTSPRDLDRLRPRHDPLLGSAARGRESAEGLGGRQARLRVLQARAALRARVAQLTRLRGAPRSNEQARFLRPLLPPPSPPPPLPAGLCARAGRRFAR
jgi:hypothetical protein